MESLPNSESRANDPADLDPLLRATDERMRIFVARIRTAESNKFRENPEDGYEVRSFLDFDVRC